MKSKKLIIFTVLAGATMFIVGCSNGHKDCYNEEYKGFSKSEETNKLELSINNHFEKAFSKDTPQELLTSLTSLFECQIEIAQDVKKTTKDEKLKGLLENYIKELKNALANKKEISSISYSDSVDLRIKVLKLFDISLYNSLMEIDKIYDINMYEDFSCYIQYLIYIYEQEPKGYEKFEPNLDSYYQFSNEIYLK